MTLDERVEFLTQSIESHDRQIGETVENIDRLTVKLDSLTVKLDSLTVKLDKLAETTQLNFDRLSTAMLGLTSHAIDHQRRIEQLER